MECAWRREALVGQRCLDINVPALPIGLPSFVCQSSPSSLSIHTRCPLSISFNTPTRIGCSVVPHAEITIHSSLIHYPFYPCICLAVLLDPPVIMRTLYEHVSCSVWRCLCCVIIDGSARMFDSSLAPQATPRPGKIFELYELHIRLWINWQCTCDMPRKERSIRADVIPLKQNRRLGKLDVFTSDWKFVLVQQ